MTRRPPYSGKLDGEDLIALTRRVRLYMFTGSGPSMTASLMLEHKGIEHERVQMMVGPHALGLLARGFHAMTVPALTIDGRRVQGSRAISRALDALEPRSPLFPSEPDRHRAVAETERWGEDLQDAVRRIVLCAARRDRRAFLSVYRHPGRRVRRAQAVSWRPVTRLASLAHGATDRAAEADVAALPARLERVDAWIAEGVLNGSELTAADFQIAPSIALLLCFEDLRPAVDGRPAARLAQRVVAEAPSEVGAVLPTAWVPPSPDAEEQGPSLLGPPHHGAPAS